MPIPASHPRKAAAALRAAAVLGVAAMLGASPSAQAQQPSDVFEGYLAELNDPSPDYVAVSNHFRHAENRVCGVDGCVLMGPTDDRDACERWSRAYNAVDPYDHTRCIELIER